LFHPPIHITAGVFTTSLYLGGFGGTVVNPEDHRQYHEDVVDDWNATRDRYEHPHSMLMWPIFQQIGQITEDFDLVAILSSTIAWDQYMRDLLPDGIDGITCVLRNNCGEVFTYELNGTRVSEPFCKTIAAVLLLHP
jgi:hypothetical protein